MTLALFDFDGTITTDDSLIKFIRHSVGDLKFLLGMVVLLPILIPFKLKLIPNYKAKQRMLSYFFKGTKAKEFKAIAQEYSLTHIDTITRPKAIEKLNWHKKQNHTIVIVSASIECWLHPWCKKNGYHLLATKLEIKDSIVTGRLQTPNCHGKEKVNRIKQAYDLEKFDYIYAYGDSAGDKEMLKLANKSHYKAF